MLVWDLGLGTLAWELWFGNFGLEALVWEFSLGNCGFELWIWEIGFGIFGLEMLVWELWFVLCLATWVWELWFRNFGLGSEVRAMRAMRPGEWAGGWGNQAGSGAAGLEDTGGTHRSGALLQYSSLSN